MQLNRRTTIAHARTEPSQSMDKVPIPSSTCPNKISCPAFPQQPARKSLGTMHQTVSWHSSIRFAFGLCLSSSLLLLFLFRSFVSLSQSHVRTISPMSPSALIVTCPHHHLPAPSFPILLSQMVCAQMHRLSRTGGNNSMI
jgi:hypothetical protein